MTVSMTPLERRIARRMVTRGEDGLADALSQLKGITFGNRFRFESLYAVGGEGAVFLVRDLQDKAKSICVGKIPLHPVHRPFEMTAEGMRERRRAMRMEAILLETNGSPFMPRVYGHFQFRNPLIDRDRGGIFAEAEPVLVMEKLPGHDMDKWIARAHRSGVPEALLRRTLDHICVVLLEAVVNLLDRGFVYADLRPGNLRVVPRPVRSLRLLDAASLVHQNDRSGRFPHVPAYLPPKEFLRTAAGEPVHPTSEILACMAGRTLYEIATGRVPVPGEEVDIEPLLNGHVSLSVAKIVMGLCDRQVTDVRHAVQFLRDNAKAYHDPYMDEATAEINRRRAAPSRRTVAVPASVGGPSADPSTGPVQMSGGPASTKIEQEWEWLAEQFLDEEAGGGEFSDAISVSPPVRTEVEVPGPVLTHASGPATGTDGSPTVTTEPRPPPRTTRTASRRRRRSPVAEPRHRSERNQDRAPHDPAPATTRGHTDPAPRPTEIQMPDLHIEPPKMPKSWWRRLVDRLFIIR